MNGLGTEKIQFVFGDYLAAGELGTRVAELRDICAPHVSSDRPTLTVGIGPPDGWPRGQRVEGRAVVWFESLMESRDYVLARERLPSATFLHGERGLDALEAVLAELGIVRGAPGGVDDAGVDALFELRGEYLRELLNEYKGFLESLPEDDGEAAERWRDFLQRVEGSAGTYGFAEISDAARRSKRVFAAAEVSVDDEDAAATRVTEAINAAAAAHHAQLSARGGGAAHRDVRHRALILATDEALARQTRLALSHSELEALVHDDPATFFEALGMVHPDVVLIQQALDGFDGFDLAAQLRLDPAYAALPIIGLTDDVSEATRSRAARCGVETWIPRPFSASTAVETVKAVLRRTDAHVALGGRDYVTGLFGRRALIDRLDLELLRARRTSELVSLMLIHVERIPEGGYPRQVLVDLARTVESTFRRSDIIGRYDERTIAAVLPGADPRVVGSLVERLDDATPRGVGVRVAASIAEGAIAADLVRADVEARMTQALGGQPSSAIGRCAHGRTEGPRTHAPRILLVDNDEAILTLLRFFCEREGFVVEQARDGLAAIEQLERAARQDALPDLVILESYLPGVDGFSVLRKVQSEFGTRVAVMMLTIQRNEERIAKAFNLGAADFVAKPFSVPEVMARIKNILVRAGAI